MDSEGLRPLEDTYVDLQVILLQQQVSVKDLMALKQDATLILDVPIANPAYLSMNGTHFAQGNIVQFNEFYGIEITQIQH